MPRHNNHQNQERKTSGYCKIRKRVSSSSSSSSVVKNYRSKRAILVGKRVNSRTPVPTWKVIMAGSRSPMQKFQNLENEVKCSKGKEAFSARKLAATLWEINGLQTPAGGGGGGGGGSGGGGGGGGGGGREGIGWKSSERIRKLFDSEQDLFMEQHFHNPVFEKVNGSKVGAHKRRSSSTSQKLQITEYIKGLETIGKASSIGVASHAPRENNISVKTRLKDVNNSLIASKELVKVLFRIQAQDEQHSSRITLVSALRLELDRARLQVDKLIRDQRFHCNEIDTLLKQFTEEKAAWKIKEKKKIQELEIERKLRRQTERLNKKLGIELGDIRANFSRVMEEFNEEQREREILEKTCDELKKESEKIREEFEKERQMLQLADVLREERVQMKLTEAKYEYEEKNAAVLESLYLKKDNENGDECVGKIDFKHFFRKIQLGSFGNIEEKEQSEGDSRRPSIDEVFKGRKSLSEKIQWENICLQKKSSDGFNKERSPEVTPNGESNESIQHI